MSIQNQTKLIDRNGDVLSAATSLQSAIDAMAEKGYAVTRIDDRTYNAYGWTFGEDGKGYYLFRNYNER